MAGTGKERGEGKGWDDKNVVNKRMRNEDEFQMISVFKEEKPGEGNGKWGRIMMTTKGLRGGGRSHFNPLPPPFKHHHSILGSHC